MKITEPTPWCYVPLYAVRRGDEEIPFAHHGTGTLIFYRERPLILTAAHVVDDATDGLLLFLATDNKLHRLPDGFFRTPVPERGSRRDDLIDVAVLSLPLDFAVGATFGPLGFYSIAELPQRSPPAGTKLKFAGYPESTEKGGNRAIHMALGSHLMLRPVCLNSPLLSGPEYPNQIDPRVCAAVPYMNERTRRTETGADAPFKPEGMSGGPIFAVEDGSVRLVGVVTNWGNKEGFLIGTWLGAVSELINQAAAAG